MRFRWHLAVFLSLNPLFQKFRTKHLIKIQQASLNEEHAREADRTVHEGFETSLGHFREQERTFEAKHVEGPPNGDSGLWRRATGSRSVTNLEVVEADCGPATKSSDF